MQPALRFVLTLAVGSLLAFPASLTLARESAGRDYARCIKACDTMRQSCNQRCSDDCRSMFPKDEEQRNTCLEQCKEMCIEEQKDCKEICQANKKPTPQEP